MGKSFNKEKLLNLFVGTDDLKLRYKKPYTKDGYVYATNGRILLRIKDEILSREYEPINAANITIPKENCNYLITYKDIEKALASVPKEEEVIEIEEDTDCPECYGSGVVDWEYTDRNGEFYEYEYDCPICNGTGYVNRAQKKTGKMIPWRDSSIKFNKKCIRTYEVQILFEAMEIIGTHDIHLVAQNNKISVFKIDENIQIIICNYIQVADYVMPQMEGGKR